MPRSGSLRANHVDVGDHTIRFAEITWANGIIQAVAEIGPEQPGKPYLIPGFVDAHVHIESSLLTPAEFARLAVRHGTVATVSDPHEIANVLGMEGVQWMLDNAAPVPFHILFGAPSCVPATAFETAGARLDASDIATLLDTPGVGYLTEVMDYPAVLAGDPAMLAKIEAARVRGLPVDGHAPGLLGEEAARYAAAGIGTDHECTSLAEAEDKLRAGMRILLREGSAARNLDQLHPLVSRYPGRVMLCTDDLHCDDLVRGHIDRLAARLVGLGHDVFTVLGAACLTAREHYGLPLGRLRVGDPMCAALLTDLTAMQVLGTWVDGMKVAENGATLIPAAPCRPVNRFAASPVRAGELRVPAPTGVGRTAPCRVILAQDGQLVTGSAIISLPVRQGWVEPVADADLAVLAVVNRYRQAPPAVALISGFGLRRGALAGSVAHDSHNVIGVGADAASLAAAINGVIAHQGGLAMASGPQPDAVRVLPLPIAGLMSDQDGDTVAAAFSELLEHVRTSLGTSLRAPFMTLSFMALLVIPALKLSDLGLFDTEGFEFVEAAC